MAREKKALNARAAQHLHQSWTVSLTSASLPFDRLLALLDTVRSARVRVGNGGKPALFYDLFHLESWAARVRHHIRIALAKADASAVVELRDFLPLIVGEPWQADDLVAAALTHRLLAVENVDTAAHLLLMLKSADLIRPTGDGPPLFRGDRSAQPPYVPKLSPASPRSTWLVDGALIAASHQIGDAAWLAQLVTRVVDAVCEEGAAAELEDLSDLVGLIRLRTIPIDRARLELLGERIVHLFVATPSAPKGTVLLQAFSELAWIRRLYRTTSWTTAAIWTLNSRIENSELSRFEILWLCYSLRGLSPREIPLRLRMRIVRAVSHMKHERLFGTSLGQMALAIIGRWYPRFHLRRKPEKEDGLTVVETNPANSLKRALRVLRARILTSLHILREPLLLQAVRIFSLPEGLSARLRKLPGAG